MTTTSSVGAPGYYPTYQTQAPAQTYGPAPTQAYGNDAYQARYAPQPGMAGAPQEEPYAIINKTDMMLGVAGAVGGFFLAGMIGLTGPIGALIFGIALLGLSAGIRGIKHMSEKKDQQQMQAVHPGFQQPQYQPQTQYQNYYSPQQTSMAPTQQPGAYNYPPQAAPQMQNMQYAQQYQQYQQPAGAPGAAPGAYPGAYPQQQSMWDKFLSWL